MDFWKLHTSIRNIKNVGKQRNKIEPFLVWLWLSEKLSKIQYQSEKSAGQLLRAKTPLYWGLRQKWMIPSCFLWKVVIFFGKEHVNWSSISGVMRGRSWKIKFGKINYLFDWNINLEFQNTPFIGSETKMDHSILFHVKSSYSFW